MLAGLFDALFNGVSIGAVLLIAALGLAIVFGLMGVINLAHGELMMLGLTRLSLSKMASVGWVVFGSKYMSFCLGGSFPGSSCCGINFRARSDSTSLWTTARDTASNLGS